MTSYNERLDGILIDYADEHRNHAYEFDNKEISQYEYFESMRNDKEKAKQAITSLIKELVAEARIDELKHLVDDDGIWYQDMARQFPQKITLNQIIKELEAWTN